jgi:hypothetical protein
MFPIASEHSVSVTCKLLDENNKVIKEQGEILNTIKDYYEKLYTSKKTDEISSKKYIFDTKLDKILNDKEKLDCDVIKT